MWDSAVSARGATRAALGLAFCPACELIWNHLFDARKVEYAPNYENALHFSALFRTFAKELAERLVREHGLAGKTVVEIGCGDGMFLAELVRAGAGRGIGFDPSMKGRLDAVSHAGVTIHPVLFDRQTAPADTALVVSRHVLEHIGMPRGFLEAVRHAVGGRDLPCYFEVPNALWTLRDLGVWDVLYEHVGYYTPGSLSRLLASCGYRVERVSACYGGQFLGVDGRTLGRALVQQEFESVAPLVDAYAEAFSRKLASWQNQLEGLLRDGRTAAVWGAGTKGVIFLNMLGELARAVELVVDQNPRKYGKHVAGVGTRIEGPEALRDSAARVVIVMNPVYAAEIGERLAALGVHADVVVA